MMKGLVIFSLVLIFVIIAFIYKFFVVKSSLTSTTLKIGEQEFQIEVAKDDASRMRGLSGREYLAPDQGMLFIFDTAGNHGFWMKGMKFPLDMVWIRDNRVVDLTENVPISKELLPAVYYPKEPILWMLELNAGSVQKYNLQVNDSIEVNSGL